MNLNALWANSNAVGFALGIVGIAVSVYYGMKARRAEALLKNISWDALDQGISFLSNWMHRKLRPDIVLTVSAPGTLVASYLLAKGDHFPNFVVAPSHLRKEGEVCKTLIPKDHFIEIEVSNWSIYLPMFLKTMTASTVCIVDDVVLTGKTTERVIKELITLGFKKENIYWATLFCTTMAKDSGASPSIFWREISNSDYYYPWGKVTGRSF